MYNIISCQKENSFSRLKNILQQGGINAVNLPIVETKTIIVTRQEIEKFKNFKEHFDFLVFLSPQGVDSLFDNIKFYGVKLKLSGVRIISVGKKTTSSLSKYGILPDIENPYTTASELYKYLIENKIVDYKKIYFAVGNNFDSSVFCKFEKSICFYSFFYSNEKRKNFDIETIKFIKKNKIDAIVFASPSEIDGFMQLPFVKDNDNFLSKKDQFPIFTIGKTTAWAVKKYGFKEIIISTLPDFEILALEILKYWGLIDS